MQLAKLSDLELVEKTKALSGEERRITAEILQCLREIDMRKLYAEYGCSSLHEFCTKVLLYSEGQAHRRITAARLLNQLPEVGEKIRTGELSLTNVAQAQAFFGDEKKQGRPLQIEQKREVLQKLEGLSSRQGEQVLAAISPERKTLTESFWALDMERLGFRTEMSRELKAKLERIKSLMKDCDTFVAAIEKMADVTLKAIDPVQKAERAASRAAKAGEALLDRAQRKTHETSFVGQPAKAKGIQMSQQRDAGTVDFHRASAGPASNHTVNHQHQADHKQIQAPRHPSTTVRLQREHTRESKVSNSAAVIGDPPGWRSQPRNPKPIPRPAIHSAVRHFVWMRDQGRCTWTHPESGERCAATRYLELDHVIPYAKGGTDDAGNLRLACRAHNMRHGVRSFGVQGMAKFKAQGARALAGSAPWVRSVAVAYDAWAYMKRTSGAGGGYENFAAQARLH